MVLKLYINGFQPECELSKMHYFGQALSSCTGANVSVNSPRALASQRLLGTTLTMQAIGDKLFLAKKQCTTRNLHHCINTSGRQSKRVQSVVNTKVPVVVLSNCANKLAESQPNSKQCRVDTLHVTVTTRPVCSR